MRHLSVTIFTLFLFGVFLIEGLGIIKEGHTIAYYCVLLMPFILFATDIIAKKTIIVPKKILILSGIFLIFSFVSVIFAVNVQNAFEYWVYYVSVFLMFIYTYNHKQKLKKIVIVLIFILSLIFTLYSTYINYFLPLKLSHLIPTAGNQYVYELYGHNALGSFLILPSIIALYFFFIKRQLRYALLFLVFLPPFLLSFDKSAYVTLVAMLLVFMYDAIRKKTISLHSLTTIFIGCIILINIFFFFLTVGNNNKNLQLKRGPIAQKLNLKKRDILSSRPYIFNIALSSIIDKPFFGVGPNNFEFAFRKYRQYVGTMISDTSHNLILDAFSENGTLAGIVFVLIAISFIKNSKKDRLIFYILGSFILLAQFDFTYRYYSFLLLFFILAGLGYDEDQIMPVSKQVFVGSFICFMIALCIIFSNWLLDNKHYVASIILYPLSQKAYIQYMQLEYNNEKSALYSFKKQINKIQPYLNIYEYLFSQDSKALGQIANLYFGYGQTMKAYRLFQKAYALDPTNHSLFEQYYYYATTMEGEEKASRLAESYCTRVLSMNNINIIQPFFYRNISFCKYFRLHH